MKRKYMLCILMIFVIIAGCAKKNNENNSKDNNENTTTSSQEEEDSAEKADAILEGLGIKSYDIWSYLRPETGEETENFINTKKEGYLLEVENGISNYEYLEDYIEQQRNLIHGRYKIEQMEPLIIKVNGKNENETEYLSEKSWQELAYFYISPNGYVFKDNDKWYEIQGYRDYKTDIWHTVSSLYWGYWGTEKNSSSGYIIDYYLYGYDKRDGDEYNEERIKEIFFPELLMKNEYKDGSCTYMCDDLTVHAYYRVYYREPDEITTKKSIDVYIGFYTMLGETKAAVCNFNCSADDESTMDYYNDITEEKLREIFTIREYK